jgi:hypothetical protein
MSARRILVGAIALGLAVAAVVAMVRYTKRVETELS